MIYALGFNIGENMIGDVVLMGRVLFTAALILLMIYIYIKLLRIKEV